jgi:hypothetical protein
MFASLISVEFLIPLRGEEIVIKVMARMCWALGMYLILAALFPLEAVARQVTFQSETIRLSIRPGQIRVEGAYVFENRSPSALTQRLYYPVPVDSAHGFPDAFLVRTEADTLLFSRIGNGISFVVPLDGGGRTIVHVAYEQRCLIDAACYILTSTAAWEAPLEQADFEIRVAEGLELEWCAYEITETSEDRRVRVHRFGRTDFMPEKDLCVRWRPRRD